MKYQDDPEAFDRLFAAKMQPESIVATLAFSGLFQMTHEAIKRAVLEEPPFFYGRSRDGEWLGNGEVQYKSEVLALAPGRTFDASLAWLVSMKAITQRQADRAKSIYDHRHDLVHELPKYLIDVNYEPDNDLFLEALEMVKDINRFRIQIEIQIGSFEQLGHVDPEDVMSGPAALLAMCIDAYGKVLQGGEVGSEPA